MGLRDAPFSFRREHYLSEKIDYVTCYVVRDNQSVDGYHRASGGIHQTFGVLQVNVVRHVGPGVRGVLAQWTDYCMHLLKVDRAQVVSKKNDVSRLEVTQLALDSCLRRRCC